MSASRLPSPLNTDLNQLPMPRYLNFVYISIRAPGCCVGYASPFFSFIGKLKKRISHRSPCKQVHWEEKFQSPDRPGQDPLHLSTTRQPFQRSLEPLPPSTSILPTSFHFPFPPQTVNPFLPFPSLLSLSASLFLNRQYFYTFPLPLTFFFVPI